ncbi:MAG: hypothetical protein N2035_06085 [Chthoniobacterales bacterium]|nr:hypothetical protein [Chthoniobacterales bacterium]
MQAKIFFVIFLLVFSSFPLFAQSPTLRAKEEFLEKQLRTIHTYSPEKPPKETTKTQKTRQGSPSQQPPYPLLQGILGQVLRSINPLQLINPFAPAYYGSGQQNLSLNSFLTKNNPTQPALIIFAIEEK